MRPLERLKKETRGSMAMEFTLLLPVLLMVVFGVIELGSAWYQQQMLVSASREGARLGALYSDTPVTNAEVEAHVQGYLTQSSFPGSATVVSTGADGSPGTDVQVTVSSNYQFPVLSSLIPGVLGSITLQSITVMRHE